MAQNRNPRLCVVFDSNVLYTQAASDLISIQARRLIEENSTHQDLDIEWYLPRVVIGERKYQMMTKARDLLPSLKKMERLLGHSFAIGDDTLECHVERTIEKNIEELKLITVDFDPDQINWHELVDRALFRLPPFEASEKEKGFRDAMIAHSFVELREKCPKTPKTCRLALVSDDRLLCEYVRSLTSNATNVRIVNSLDELETLVNTLVSTVSEDFISELVDKASNVFFVKEENKSLFYKEDVRGRIKDTFKDILTDTLIQGSLRSNKTWYISDPIFIKKDRSRLHWVSPIEVEFEIFHYKYKAPTSEDTPSLAEALGGFGYTNDNNIFSARRGLLSIPNTSEKIADFEGKEKFEVEWSCNLTSAKNLTSPTINDINHLGNDFPDKE